MESIFNNEKIKNLFLDELNNLPIEPKSNKQLYEEQLIESKLIIKQRIKYFLESYYEDKPISIDTLQIHKISIEHIKNVFEIEITLGLPSLIIGSKGIILDSLKIELEQKLNIKVEINLKEYNVWI